MVSTSAGVRVRIIRLRGDGALAREQGLRPRWPFFTESFKASDNSLWWCWTEKASASRGYQSYMPRQGWSASRFTPESVTIVLGQPTRALSCSPSTPSAGVQINGESGRGATLLCLAAKTTSYPTNRTSEKHLCIIRTYPS